MDRDIHQMLIEESIRQKNLLIKQILTECLGKEPEIHDYKNVTLGSYSGNDYELIMFEGIELGRIQLTTKQKGNSIMAQWEFIPTKY